MVEYIIKPANSYVRKGIIVFFLIIFAISGVVFAENQTNDKALLKVTLMIFSGQPNPSYYIEDQNTVNDFKALFVKHRKNVNFRKETVIPGKLGYQGIIVENLKEIKDLPKKFMIFNNDIEILDSGNTLKSSSGKEFLVDDSGGIETFFLDYGVSKNAYKKELREIIRETANK